MSLESPNFEEEKILPTIEEIKESQKNEIETKKAKREAATAAGVDPDRLFEHLYAVGRKDLGVADDAEWSEVIEAYKKKYS